MIDEHFQHEDTDVTDKLNRVIREMQNEGENIAWDGMAYFLLKHEEAVVKKQN